MKQLFAVFYLVMFALTGVAMWMKPPVDNSKLVWVTDANPVRTEQMNLFKEQYPEYDIMIDPNNTGKQKVIVQSLAGVGPDFFDTTGNQLPDVAEAGIALDITPIVEMARQPDPSPETFRDRPYFQFLHQRLARSLERIGQLSAWTPEALSRNPYYSYLRRRELNGWREANPGKDPPADFTAEVEARTARRCADFARASAAERDAEAQRVAVQYAVDVGKALDPDLIWYVGKDAVEHNGRVYGHPCNIWNCLIAYHKDLFDQEGLPYPRADWTWQDLLETAKRLTKRDEKGTPLQFGLLALDSFELAHGFGAEFYNETKTKCIFNSPEAVRAYRFYVDLRYKHGVLPTPSEQANMAAQGGWGGGSINQFGAKLGAMMRFGRYGMINWRLMNAEQVKKGNPPALHIGFVPPPAKVEPGSTLGRPFYFGGSRMAVINSRSPRKWEALDFLHYLAGPVYGRQINWSADCIPGARKWTQTRAQISNPEFPEEHDTDFYWRDVADDIHPFPESVFLPDAKMWQSIGLHRDRIETRLCSVEDGLRDMELDVNQAIAKYVRERPYLHEPYRKALEEQDKIDRAKGRTPRKEAQP